MVSALGPRPSATIVLMSTRFATRATLIAATALSGASLLASCSSPSASVSYPPGAKPVTAAPPPEVPVACSGRTYYEIPNPASLCSGAIYFLCDGAAYGEYTCAAPGAGWTPAGATIPAPSGSPFEPASESASSSSEASRASASAAHREGGEAGERDGG